MDAASQAHSPTRRKITRRGYVLLGGLGLAMLALSRAQPSGPPAGLDGVPASPEAWERGRRSWSWRDRFDESRPRTPQVQFSEIPELTTAPHGQFNRLRGQLIERQERFRTFNEQVMEQAQRLEEMRERSPFGRPRLRDLPEVRDALAQMHVTVDQMVTEAERARAFLQTDIVPHLPQMLSEVQAERQALPAEDARQERLTRVEEALTRWAQSPDQMLDLFDPGRRSRGGPPEPEGDQGPDSRRVVRRLERMEAMQRHLQEQMESLDREIEHMREFLDGLPPEQIERLEGLVPQAPAPPPPPPVR